MSLLSATPNTLLGRAQPKSGTARIAWNVALIVLGSLLLALSAQIKVPTWPVPVTLQTLAVAFVAAAFGARIGVATVVLYLAEGLAGLPVFASGGGPLYLFGPTGGFLIAYIPMAFVIGAAADRSASSSFPKLFGAMLIGEAFVFGLGFFWLLALAGEASWIDQTRPIASAFEKAVQPFVIWDAVKMALAAIMVTGSFALLETRKR
ncbi:MAG: biotin transporter BioY [Hyphomicrobiaceae bacterium]|nr:biotin transporter BioY [Hyphomicrobiaceae bacterium]MCC0023105.1 biotin transporter BioY [Hyphomicrobiaceae bacterium]